MDSLTRYLSSHQFDWSARGPECKEHMQLVRRIYNNPCEARLPSAREAAFYTDVLLMTPGNGSRLIGQLDVCAYDGRDFWIIEAKTQALIKFRKGGANNAAYHQLRRAGKFFEQHFDILPRLMLVIQTKGKSKLRVREIPTRAYLEIN